MYEDQDCICPECEERGNAAAWFGVLWLLALIGYGTYKLVGWLIG